MRQNRRQWTKGEKAIIGLLCANCGSMEDLQYHHIVPLALGGNDIMSNMTCLCGKCHDKIHFGGSTGVNHRQAVINGIRASQAKGVHHGKKPANHEHIMRLIAENSTQFNPFSEMTENEIMEKAGVKSVCYHKCKKELMEAIKADVWPYEWAKPKVCRNMSLYDWKIKKLRGE